jgi:O-antigen ligase
MFLPGAVSILLLITLALTFTRSAALGFAAMMITFMIIAFRNNTLRKPVLILLIIVAVSLISLIAYKPVNDSIKLHFYQTMQQHIADRKKFWTDGMNVFMARPILGVGIANYRNGLLEYAGKDAVLVPSHNQYIQLAAETGAIGFLSYLLILFYGFKLSVEMSAKAADPTIKLMAACFLGIWAWYCIQSFFSTYLFDDKFSMMFWLMLGINAALFRIYTVSLKADTDTIIRR